MASLIASPHTTPAAKIPPAEVRLANCEGGCERQFMAFCLGKVALSWPSTAGGERRIELNVCEQCQDRILGSIQGARPQAVQP